MPPSKPVPLTGLIDEDDLPRALQPKGWPRPSGYANGMTAKGRVVVTGGVVGWDVMGNFPPTFAAQARQTFSNIMAILGLRSLYFALAGIIQRFYYLKVSLALLLALIGAKMLMKDVLESLPGTIYYTLGSITLILTGGVVASIIRARRTPESRWVEIPARRNLVTGGHG